MSGGVATRDTCGRGGAAPARQGAPWARAARGGLAARGRGRPGWERAGAGAGAGLPSLWEGELWRQREGKIRLEYPVRSGRRSFKSWVSQGAACRWVWQGGGTVLLWNSGFGEVQALHWIFSNVLPNAAVNGRSPSLGHGSGLASDGTALSGRVDAGCRLVGQARPLAPLTASSSPECIFEVSWTASTAWPSTPAAASQHPAVLPTATGDPQPLLFSTSIQIVSPARVSTNSTHLKALCNDPAVPVQHLQSCLLYCLRSLICPQIHPCSSRCSNGRLCWCVNTWGWNWTPCHLQSTVSNSHLPQTLIFY